MPNSLGENEREGWIKLGDPCPLKHPLVYTPFEWPISGVIWLKEIVPNLINSDITSLLTQRRTQRNLGAIEMNDLNNLCHLTCRAYSWGSDVLGFSTSLRPTPSAGAIHPIHILFSSFDDKFWMLYSPDCNSMKCLVHSLISPAEVRRGLETVADSHNATIVLFVAEPGKTAAKYENPSSLIWRDAGNLQGVMTVAATALSLSLWQLGVTGDSWAKQFGEHRRLFGVGVALLGREIK